MIIFSHYIWIVITGGIFMFGAAMGIGANDVANAFATSIGSKALTMKSALIIAVICEMGGGILMGSQVTETIRKDIANYECFEDSPVQLMYGCMYVLLSVTFWLFLSSKYEMPVSTTHSCVGGMIGMALALGGGDCVNWFSTKSTFPYVGGVGGILLSWLFSPILSMILSIILFSITRFAVLRRADSLRRSFISFPILIGLTLILNSFFIIYKGGKGIGTDDIELWMAVVISFSIGIGVALLMIPVIPHLKKCVKKRFDKLQEEKMNKIISSSPTEIELAVVKTSPMMEIKGEIVDVEMEKGIPNNDSQGNLSTISTMSSESSGSPKDYFSRLNDKLQIDNDKLVNQIHDNAEKFDEQTEESFKILQIFTAICDSFSHGANDIANSVGPYSAIISIWLSGRVTEDSTLGDNSYWILSLGGVGIAVGLLVYGHKIIKAIGLKVCKLTPSRGFSIELSSATIIIIGSRLGIPLSTTHCQVGATIGVGLLENQDKNIVKEKCQCAGLNVKILLKTFMGWVLTLLIVAGTSALFVAQGVYVPEVIPPNATIHYQPLVANLSNFTNITV